MMRGVYAAALAAFTVSLSACGIDSDKQSETQIDESKFSYAAGSLQPWQDIEIVSQNKEVARTSFQNIEHITDGVGGENKPEMNSPFMDYLSLNGDWKFKWSESFKSRPKEFFKPSFDVGAWDNIPVPSVWERQGYGYPVYANIDYPFHAEPFIVPDDNQNHVGSYVKTVSIPDSWNGKPIFIEFGAVSSAMTLWVNGKEAGYNQGSRTPAEFDITQYVKPGPNIIAVQVMRWSDASWLENQDSWSLSGIFRDVSLYARPKVHMRDYFAATSLQNNYRDGMMDLTVDIRDYYEGAVSENWSVKYEIIDQDKSIISGIVPIILSNGKAKAATKIVFENVQAWSAENPYLYDLNLTLIGPEGQAVETAKRNVGFRSVELKNGLMLVNGKAIKLRGVNVHEIHPVTGYVVDEAMQIADIKLLKAGNFNAVRTSHYPQHPRFYELADRYGLYVIDEANLETHLYRYNPDLAPARKTEWAEQMLDRTQRMVERDKNHPSIIMWSPGNETGPGKNMVAIYDWAKRRDPSRLFQYADDTHTEGGDFSQLGKREFGKSTDILGAFYPSPWRLEEYAQEHGAVSWIMMEYWHSMGNSLGNGEAYWDTIYKHPILQGGFIWDWVDQGLAEIDDTGRPFYGQGGDYGPEGTPSSNNFLHNGVVFPDRTPKPAYWNVKKAYQPAKFTPIDLSNGVIEITNRHNFTNLSNYVLNWTVLEDGKAVKSGRVETLSGEAGSDSRVKLGVIKPSLIKDGAEYHLNLTLRRKAWPAPMSDILSDEHVVADEQFELPFRAEVQSPAETYDAIEAVKEADIVSIAGKDFSVGFDTQTGRLISYDFMEQSLIQDAIVPNMWRAMTDNDYGFAPNTWDFSWRQIAKNSKLTEFKWEKTRDDIINVQSAYSLLSEGGKSMGTYRFNYDVNGDGTIHTHVKFQRSPDVRMPPRVGLRFALGDEYKNLQWLGRGPYENYIDRKWASYVGSYKSTVSEQYVPYLRPQENGYKTDTRWLTLTDEAGIGLAIIAKDKVGFSTLENPIEDFEAKDEVWQSATDKDRQKPTLHLNDLPNDRQGVFVNIDTIQAGVGGDNSWAKRTHNAFTPRDLNYDFEFILKGISIKDMDVADTARRLRSANHAGQ